MYKQLYVAANNVVYEGRVASAYKSSNLSPLLRHLLDNLPEFTVGNSNYKLNSFPNIINVDDKHQTITNGSSCNGAEVEIIESLIKQLKVNRKPASSIVILIRYHGSRRIHKRLPKRFIVQGVQSSAQVLEIGPVESSNQDVRVKYEADEELRHEIA